MTESQEEVDAIRASLGLDPERHRSCPDCRLPQALVGEEWWHKRPAGPEGHTRACA